MNDEFYTNGQMKNEIELGMTKEQSYTVVLMLFGGMDDVFLNTFNFGVWYWLLIKYFIAFIILNNKLIKLVNKMNKIKESYFLPN